MRLTRWLRARPRPQPTGGAEARQRAERELERVQAETADYAALARDLREIRRRNHLAEAFQQIAPKGGH